MSKIIQQQLKKLTVAKIDSYDALKHTYLFKQHQSMIFKVDACYILKLDDLLLNATSNELLVSNWNNGNYPKHKYMRAQVTKKVGNMLYLCGVYCDENKNNLNEFWNGWLPDEQLEIVEEVK